MGLSLMTATNLQQDARVRLHSARNWNAPNSTADQTVRSMCATTQANLNERTTSLRQASRWRFFSWAAVSPKRFAHSSKTNVLGFCRRRGTHRSIDPCVENKFGTRPGENGDEASYPRRALALLKFQLSAWRHSLHLCPNSATSMPTSSKLRKRAFFFTRNSFM